MALLLMSGTRILQCSKGHWKHATLRYTISMLTMESSAPKVTQKCSGNLLTRKSSPLYSIVNILKSRLSGISQSRSFHVTRTVRQYGSKSRSPLETNTNVATDTVLFTYSNDQLYRIITIFGIVQFFLWAHLAFFSYSTMGMVKNYEDERPDLKTTSQWGKVFDLQNKYKDGIAVTCVCIGYAVMFFAWLYPLRSINKLTLLQGGKNLGITTYSHFGKKKYFKIPLDHLSCVDSRTSTTNTISAKIKGRWFYFVMDKRKGHFHNTELFDFAVGLKRKF